MLRGETPGGWNRATGRLVLAAAAAVLLGIAGVAAPLLGWRSSGEERLAGPERYAYSHERASNGVMLHVLRTRPDNVTLRAIDANVTETELFGINGGFFYEGAVLSMAIVDGKPVQGIYGAYGTGTVNARLPRGTLVWDRVAGTLGVQVVRQPEELVLTDRNRYWAQGGVSMSLQSGAGGWVEQAMEESLPFPEEKRLRSGAVYDEGGELYLVVSSNRATAEQFRTAVLERVGGGRLVDGIFLDGDGSSQLRCREASLRGDGRPVYEMLALLE